MRPGIYVFFWLTISGCVDFCIFADGCENFTHVEHETVAQRTVTLSFKIVNTCANGTVEFVYAFFHSDNPNVPHSEQMLCRFTLSNGTCDHSLTHSIGCTCDDQGTFRVMAVLGDDQPEVWKLRARVSSDLWFVTDHEVWADELTKTTFLTTESTTTTTTSTTKGFPTTDSTGNTSHSTRNEMQTIDITENTSTSTSDTTSTRKDCPTIHCTNNTSDEFRTRMIIVLIIMVAVLFLILICTCILYCTA